MKIAITKKQKLSLTKVYLLDEGEVYADVSEERLNGILAGYRFVMSLKLDGDLIQIHVK